MQNPINVDAHLSQQHLTVRLPMSQIISLFLAAGIMLAGFWITNDRLSNKVDILGVSIAKFSDVLERVQLAQHDQEVRLRVLEVEADK